jgi:hypothetical protein
MKEKILLINFLDDTLQLGFKNSLSDSQRNLLNKINKEKIKENQILKNFALIENLKKKSN